MNDQCVDLPSTIGSVLPVRGRLLCPHLRGLDCNSVST